MQKHLLSPDSKIVTSQERDRAVYVYPSNEIEREIDGDDYSTEYDEEDVSSEHLRDLEESQTGECIWN